MTEDNFSKTDIAIIGMAGRFPDAENVDQLWNNIINKIESIKFFDDSDLSQAGVSPSLLKEKNYIKAKGYLKNASLFDADFFNFSDYEAKMLDPQFRVFMEVAWEALEDAAYIPGNDKEKVGVFAGSSTINNYYLSNIYNNNQLPLSSQSQEIALLTYYAKDFLTTLLAYKLNLTGPCITIQTACSTSLVAICTACEYLLNDKCDIALAGGISITTPLKSGYLYQKEMILSSDGHCRAFDASASGTVPGNGAGILVLKRLDKALKDHDHIHAIIKGFAVNNDGNDKIGFAAPSIVGQENAILSALDMANIDASMISYIETHGTGTRFGDPIEIAALSSALSKTKTNLKEASIALGTLKPNIGHLDTAAGVAGIIKTVQALKHNILPPNINYERLNPEISFSDTPFYINTTPENWPNDTQPRLAGVSCFGMGGTNAHVILQESSFRTPEQKNQPFVLLVLSAKKRSALIRRRRSLIKYLQSISEANLENIAYTLQVGRKEMKERFCCICNSKEEAINQLKNLDSQIIVDTTHHALTDADKIYYENLKSMAINWMSGNLINWNELYPNKTPYRVSLPTYPFEGREHWIEPNINIPLNESKKSPDQQGDLEIKIKDIFKSFLGIDKIKSVDDFFDLGGDSLLTLQVIAEIKKNIGVSLSPEILGKYSTAKDIAKYIKNKIAEKNEE